MLFYLSAFTTCLLVNSVTLCDGHYAETVKKSTPSSNTGKYRHSRPTRISPLSSSLDAEIKGENDDFALTNNNVSKERSKSHLNPYYEDIQLALTSANILRRMQDNSLKSRTKRSTDSFNAESKKDEPSVNVGVRYPFWPDDLTNWQSDLSSDNIDKDLIPRGFDLLDGLDSMYEMKQNGKYPDIFGNLKSKPARDIDKTNGGQWPAQHETEDNTKRSMGSPELDESVTNIQYVFDDISPVTKRMQFNAWGGKREYHEKETDIGHDKQQQDAKILESLIANPNDPDYLVLIVRILRRLKKSDIKRLGKTLGYLKGEKLSDLRKKKTSFSAWGGKRSIVREKRHIYPSTSVEDDMVLTFLREKLAEDGKQSLSDLDTDTLLSELRNFFKRLMDIIRQMDNTGMAGAMRKRLSFNAWGGKRSIV